MRQLVTKWVILFLQIVVAMLIIGAMTLTPAQA